MPLHSNHGCDGVKAALSEMNEEVSESKESMNGLTMTITQ